MQSQIVKSYHQPIFKCESTPSTLINTNDRIFISFKDYTIASIDKSKMTIVNRWQTNHCKRITALNYNDNIFFSASYDSNVKLWDCRTNNLIHNFNKIGKQFTALDSSQHILAAAYKSNIVFWDLRKMKQRGQFTESFNGQITCIKFDKDKHTNLIGCSLDGMINKFDLTKSNQEEALEWGYRIQQSPQSFIHQNDYTIIKTSEHMILTLFKQDVISKEQYNYPQIPKHILQYSLVGIKQGIRIYLWNIDQRRIQSYENKTLLGYVHNVEDIEVMTSITNNQKLPMAFWGDQNGNFYLQKLTKIQKISNQKRTNIIQQQYSTKNGYIINKPSTLKSLSKKFKPY